MVPNETYCLLELFGRLQQLQFDLLIYCALDDSNALEILNFFNVRASKLVFAGLLNLN